MISARNSLVISDDIPSAFLTDMLFNPGSVAAVFSEEDAVLEAEIHNQRSPHPRQRYRPVAQHHPSWRPR